MIKAQFENFRIFLPLWFYVKLVLADFRRSETAVLTIWTTLNFYFLKNFTLENVRISKNSKFKRVKWWKQQFQGFKTAKIYLFLLCNDLIWNSLAIFLNFTTVKYSPRSCLEVFQHFHENCLNKSSAFVTKPISFKSIQNIWSYTIFQEVLLNRSPPWVLFSMTHRHFTTISRKTLPEISICALARKRDRKLTVY